MIRIKQKKNFFDEEEKNTKNDHLTSIRGKVPLLYFDLINFFDV
jgi:hypothetical protein